MTNTEIGRYLEYAGWSLIGVATLVALQNAYCFANWMRQLSPRAVMLLAILKHPKADWVLDPRLKSLGVITLMSQHGTISANVFMSYPSIQVSGRDKSLDGFSIYEQHLLMAAIAARRDPLIARQTTFNDHKVDASIEALYSQYKS